MKKIKVAVLAPHPLFDSNGSMLLSGRIYSIADDALAAQFLIEGLITTIDEPAKVIVSEEPQEKEVKEEVKKSANNKSNKSQETETLSQ